MEELKPWAMLLAMKMMRGGSWKARKPVSAQRCCLIHAAVQSENDFACLKKEVVLMTNTKLLRFMKTV